MSYDELSAAIFNWPVLVIALAIAGALWVARRIGIDRGILIGRAQILREYYRKKEGQP